MIEFRLQLLPPGGIFSSNLMQMFGFRMITLERFDGFHRNFAQCFLPPLYRSLLKMIEFQLQLLPPGAFLVQI